MLFHDLSPQPRVHMVLTFIASPGHSPATVVSLNNQQLFRESKPLNGLFPL